MERLHNNQYNEFILSHIIRPYQLTLGLGDKPIKSLTFVSKNKSHMAYYYGDLLKPIYENKDWSDKVFGRLARCYSHIDFSFFRDDLIGSMIKIALIDRGVKPMTIDIDLKQMPTQQSKCCGRCDGVHDICIGDEREIGFDEYLGF